MTESTSNTAEKQLRFHEPWELSLSFLELDQHDWELISESEEYLKDEIPVIVRELYEQFLNHDGTAEFYTQDDGTLNEESYEHRIEGFERWFEQIFNHEFTEENYRKFLEDVALIHTEEMGFEKFDIPFDYMIPTMGFLFDRIASILSSSIKDEDQLSATLSAWNRFLLMQLRLMHESSK